MNLWRCGSVYFKKIGLTQQQRSYPLGIFFQFFKNIHDLLLLYVTCDMKAKPFVLLTISPSSLNFNKSGRFVFR